MVQGRICLECGYYMYALSEEEEPGGSWILYECRNERYKFREKVFEAGTLTYHPIDEQSHNDQCL